jgi:hypothetical protein
MSVSTTNVSTTTTDATTQKNALSPTRAAVAAVAAVAAAEARAEPDDLAVDTVDRRDAPDRTMVYGPGGVGKSTFASQCPGIYFLGVEEGANQIHVAKYKHAFKTLKVFDDAMSKLRHKRHPYRGVCVDALGALEELFVEAIEERLRTAGGKGAKSIAEMNDDYGAGYALIRDEWRSVLRRLDDLREARDMRVILVAHSKTETVHNLEGKDYQRYTIDLLGSKSVKLVTNWCDNVLFARQDVLVAAMDKKKVQARNTLLSLYARGSGSWDAKTRGDVPWPERLPLDWETFERVRLLVAEHGRDLADRLRARFAAVEAGIAEDSRARARAVFDGAVSGGQWHMADAVLEQAEEEARDALTSGGGGGSAAVAGGEDL